MINLIHGDCIEEMNKLIADDVKVDLILTDPPYGTLNGVNLKGWNKNTTKWDNIIPTEDMFNCCENLLRMNGNMILFSQEPYTSHLRQYTCTNLPFVYPYYWLKNHFANNLLCNKAPVSYIEDLSVFRKKYDTDYSHPLRQYSKKIIDYVGSRREIINKIGGRIDHFLRYNSSQFTLCTYETYKDLVKEYNINACEWFMPFEELEDINENFKSVFNLNFNLGDNKYKSNVLKYSKSQNHFHPTEKPVELLEDLIKTYTNENDLVLDFTMGSGSTGVACNNLNRDFIGIELNKEYYDIAVERCNPVQQRLI